MSRSYTVSPMYSEVSLKGAVIVVDGRPGKITAVDPRNSAVFVDIPAVYYELTGTDLVEVTPEILEARAAASVKPDSLPEISVEVDEGPQA